LAQTYDTRLKAHEPHGNNPRYKAPKRMNNKNYSQNTINPSNSEAKKYFSLLLFHLHVGHFRVALLKLVLNELPNLSVNLRLADRGTSQP
jgi:hypothetical protein